MVTQIHIHTLSLCVCVCVFGMVAFYLKKNLYNKYFINLSWPNQWSCVQWNWIPKKNLQSSIFTESSNLLTTLHHIINLLSLKLPDLIPEIGTIGSLKFLTELAVFYFCSKRFWEPEFLGTRIWHQKLTVNRVTSAG